MDIQKLVETGARAICIEMGNNPDTDVGMIAGEGCALWECFTHEASSVLAVALAEAAEDWIAVAQSGFETWKVKPHNARWFRKIDGTPIPNDLTICIGEAFAERFRTLAAQLGGKTDA